MKEESAKSTSRQEVGMSDVIASCFRTKPQPNVGGREGKWKDGLEKPAAPATEGRTD